LDFRHGLLARGPPTADDEAGWRSSLAELAARYSRLLYLSHVEGCGVDLFGEICGRDLEGIIAKWKHGAYVSGDVTSWVMIKNPTYSQSMSRWEQLRRKPVRKTVPNLPSRSDAAEKPLPRFTRPTMIRPHPEDSSVALRARLENHLSRLANRSPSWNSNRPGGGRVSAGAFVLAAAHG
jgi:hypothetical protein